MSDVFLSRCLCLLWLCVSYPHGVSCLYILFCQGSIFDLIHNQNSFQPFLKRSKALSSLCMLDFSLKPGAETSVDCCVLSQHAFQDLNDNDGCVASSIAIAPITVALYNIVS